jgi:hypothetical protein
LTIGLWLLPFQHDASHFWVEQIVPRRRRYAGKSYLTTSNWSALATALRATNRENWQGTIIFSAARRFLARVHPAAYNNRGLEVLG